MPSKKVPVRITTRNISGRGIIQVPQDKNIRVLYLYTQVVRLPKTNFTNSKYNPDRSEYAKVTWIRKDYVLKEQALNYEMELQTWEQDSIAYLAYAHVCMYKRIMDYFAYISVAVRTVPLEFNTDIYVEPLQSLPDQIKIVCRLDTAIVCELWRYDYDLACSEADTQPPPPPDPPKKPSIPPGTPITDISPPYDQPNDGGDTVPNPGDGTTSPDNPGLGEPCQVVTVVYITLRLDGQQETGQRQLYAPIYDAYLRRTGTPGVNYAEEVIIDCAVQQPDMCNNGEHELVNSGTGATTPIYDSVLAWTII